MRIQYDFDGDAFADGGGGDKFLIDLTQEMSEIYGRLVPQGQVFRVRSMEARLINPDHLAGVQDQAIAVSGKFIYYHPTHFRKEAWRNAKKTWVANRKALGVKSRSQDFRIGFGEGYSTDVGWGRDGVVCNAWVNAADDPLMFAATSDNQDIFGNWTNNFAVQQPDLSYDSFGHWAQKDADSLLDELSFVTNEGQYFALGNASKAAQSVGFMVNFSAWFDDANSDPSDFASATNADRAEGPFDVMCGLIGVYVDSTTVDDTETQTQDWRLEIVIDVEEWSPINRRKSGKSKSKKGRKK